MQLVVRGTRVLSEAENWYVPSRLTPDESGARNHANAVRPSHPVARAVSRDICRGASLVAAACGLGAGIQAPRATAGVLAIPGALFMHRAVLYASDHRPFVEVREVYQRDILAFSPPPAR